MLDEAPWRATCVAFAQDVKHLILVDATWRFAREMASLAPEDPLQRVRRVELSPPRATRPVFVVRKPMLLEEETWGFSTAEAAALAVDEVAQLRGGAGEAWQVVAKALKAYAQHQLEHTEATCLLFMVVMGFQRSIYWPSGAAHEERKAGAEVSELEKCRPGFIPKLYDAWPDENDS